MRGFLKRLGLGSTFGLPESYHSLVRNLDGVSTQIEDLKGELPKIPLKRGFYTLNFTIMQGITTVYGVDNLKTVITFLGGRVNEAVQIDKNGDGKVDFTEIIGYSLGTASLIPGILPSFSLIDEEAKDLDNNEWDELVQHVLNTDFLPDDKEQAEHFIKATVFVLNVNRQYIRFASRVFKGEEVRFEPLQGLL